MNKVFLFALQLGVLAPFWRSMQALLWANSGRASEGALWNIVYCGGPLLIACALARWRILKGKETFSLIQAVCGVLLALLRFSSGWGRLSGAYHRYPGTAWRLTA